MKTAARLLVCALVLSLSACGFHLRGTANVAQNYQPVRVSSIELDHRFADFLQWRWRTQGIKIATGVESSASNVQIVRTKQSRELLSTDGAGNPLEYELILQVWFRFSTPNHDQKLGKQGLDERVEARRAYRFNVGQLLVSEADAQRLEEDMRESLADAILSRIAQQTNGS